VWVWVQSQVGTDIADWIHQVSHGGWPINNMYQVHAATERTPWTCDMCQYTGKRLNEYFGICKNQGCEGVRTEGSRQDVTMGEKNKRRVDTVLIKSSQAGCNTTRTHTYFTDASGQVVNEESGIMQTGWGIVQVEIEGTSMTVQWGRAVQGYPSVQKCEALAVLEVIKTVDKCSKVHIHTDSKGTVQVLRKMATKKYRQKRKLKMHR